MTSKFIFDIFDQIIILSFSKVTLDYIWVRSKVHFENIVKVRVLQKEKRFYKVFKLKILSFKVISSFVHQNLILSIPLASQYQIWSNRTYITEFRFKTEIIGPKLYIQIILDHKFSFGQHLGFRSLYWILDHKF